LTSVERVVAPAFDFPCIHKCVLTVTIHLRLLLPLKEAKQQLMQLYRNMRAMAFLVLPLARVSQESLTAVYARTFEKAAFGFAKVRPRTSSEAIRTSSSTST
jgi:hypothetical protein